MNLVMRRSSLDHLPPMPRFPAGYGLRTANLHDGDALTSIMVSAFGADWSLQRVLSTVLEAEDVDTTFVVTAYGVPVATASARLVSTRPESGYLHWVATHAEHRRKQLGYGVSLAVLHRLGEVGCRDSLLETQPFRIAAIRLYLRLGFVPEESHNGQTNEWQQVFSKLREERDDLPGTAQWYQTVVPRVGRRRAADRQQPVSVTTGEPARRLWKIMTSGPAIDSH
jgi:mycothiol synthase